MRREEAIRAAAAQLFYERGVAAVSVDEIGRAAGVTGPAIYRYFKNKDAILASLFDESMDEIVWTTGGRFEEPAEELEHLAREHARYIQTHPHIASVWIREERSLIEPYRSRYFERANRYISRWNDCVRRCYPEAASDEVARAVAAAIGMLNSLPSWRPAMIEPEDLPDSLAAYVTHALAALGEASHSRTSATRSASPVQ